MRNFILVSMETTDLPSSGGVPVDITLQLIKNKEVVDEYVAYIIPQSPVSAVAEGAHNMGIDWLTRYGRPSKDVFVEVWQFLQRNSHGFPLYILGNDVGFQIAILNNWFAEQGYPGQLSQFLSPSGADIAQIADFLNEAYIEAGGEGSHIFKNPKNGRPSIALEAQALTLDISYENRDARPSKGKAIAILEIYRSHIQSTGEDFAQVLKGKNEVDTFVEGSHCVNCGAVTVPDPTYVYAGAQKLDCVLCGETFVVQHIDNG